MTGVSDVGGIGSVFPPEAVGARRRAADVRCSLSSHVTSEFHDRQTSGEGRASTLIGVSMQSMPGSVSSPWLCETRVGGSARRACERVTALDVISAAELAIAESGMTGLTIRSLSVATGCSCATIRDAYGSRAGVIGHTWLRAYRRFLTLLASLVEETGGGPLERICAAAEASVLYPRQYPRSAALLTAVSREAFVRRPLPGEIVRQLRVAESELTEILRRLTRVAWNRDDVAAVDVMSACVIDLPKWILSRRERTNIYFVREYLRDAVRAVVECGPPPTRPAAGVCAVEDVD